MFERFTDRARRVLVLAQEEARLLNHGFIGTEHLLLGLIHEGEGVAARALDDLDISLEAVREKVEETIGLSGTAPIGSPPFTPRAKKVLELSMREALQLGHNYIGTEHLLLGVVREGEGVAAQVLVSLGADLGRVRRQVIQLLSGHPGVESVGGFAMQSGPVARTVHRGQVVECSFCGRRPPVSGQLISGRGGAYICEHCVSEWSIRLDGSHDDQSEEDVAVEAAGEVASAMDLGFSDDPDDSTSTIVRITGVPDQAGIAAHLFRALSNHSIHVQKIVQNTSESGSLEISFTMSKAAQSAFIAAYSEFHDEILGPGEAR